MTPSSRPSLKHFEQADPEYAKRVELALAALQR